MGAPRPSTFSIVAFDPKTKDLGVAVESKFVAVGAVVPFARAGVGAIATQSYANTAYGPKALAMMKRGLAPKEVLKKLVAADKDAAQRQVGLLAALSAGQRAGGDRRGQQSAALLVVREDGGYGGFNDRWIDVRVDDHPQPIEELIRAFNVYDVTLLNREDPKDVVRLTPEVVREMQAGLAKLGLYRGPVSGRLDAKTKAAFEGWVEVNNFENKLRRDDQLWGSVLRAFRAEVQHRNA